MVVNKYQADVEDVEVRWRWEMEGVYIMSPFLLSNKRWRKLLLLLLNRGLISSELEGESLLLVGFLSA